MKRLLITFLYLCIFSKCLFTNVNSSSKVPDAHEIKKLEGFSKSYLNQKLKYESSLGEPDYDSQFQDKYAKEPGFLFQYYLKKTVHQIKKHIDNYLFYAEEGLYLKGHSKKIDGRKLSKYFKWTKMFANKTKGIFKKFSMRKLNRIMKRLSYILRMYKEAEKVRAGLPKNFESYFKAFKSGIKFTRRLRRAIRKHYKIYQMKLKRRTFTNIP